MGDLIPLHGAGQHPSILVPVHAPDGRRLHRFRQSSLKEIDLCMERARRTMGGLVPKRSNDANELGTAVHAAIEVCIDSMIEGQGPLGLDSLVAFSSDVFDEATEQPGFEWVKAKSFATVHGRIEKCLMAWWGNVLPTLNPAATELAWGPLVIYEDADRIIELTGCIDYVDAVDGPADWKTSGREWAKWEHDRWDIQATAYTWALEHQWGMGPWGHPTPFTFHVLHTDGDYTKNTVYRHSGDWAWLKERVLVVAKMIEAELPEWPLNDNHALCSPTWCPAWATCKGKHFADGWPKQSLPR